MKVQIATALIASYAVADTPTVASKASCEGFYAGLIGTGWDCTFEASKVKTCTKENLTFDDDDAEAACGDDFTMAQPTVDTCKAYTDAEIKKKADWTATATI